MRSVRRNAKASFSQWIGWFVISVSLVSPKALAVVGQAEGFDIFEEERLEEYQQALLDEQTLQEMDVQEDYIDVLQKKEEELKEVTEGELQDVLQEEIEVLRRRLLQIPKRDRFHLETNGDYTYDSNIGRRVPREEKGDSVFNVRTTFTTDLSGKRTDFRTDASFDRQWNIIFSESDSRQYEKRFRFRRKIFKKLNTSVNSRISKNNTKTIEIDSNKIRWDFNNQLAINYPFSEKLSFNSSFSSAKRLFRQEAFDQDSSWEVTASPSAFWNITPKSRVSLGYTFGASRLRVKSGDANNHEINLGYFGQLTRKASASATISYSHQKPRSLDTAESKGVTVGIGTIWQWTPKTQLALQFTRALQNSTSELATGEVDGINTVTKTDTHFTNDSLVFSLNTRLIKRLTAVMNLGITHTRNKTFDDALTDDVETRQFSFPLSASLTYAIKRWITLQFTYRFNFRTGNEKADTSRAHTWFSALRMVF